MAQQGALRYSFGRVVRSLRLQAGFSQERLAQEADLARNYVGEVERGEKSPTLDVIEALAWALDTQPHDLVEQAEKGHMSGC